MPHVAKPVAPMSSVNSERIIKAGQLNTFSVGVGGAKGNNVEAFAMGSDGDGDAGASQAASDMFWPKV